MGASIEEKERDPTKDWQDQEDKSGLIDREKERYRDKDFEKRLEIMERLQDRLEILTAGRLPLRDFRKQRADKEKKEARGEDFREGRPIDLSLEEAAKLGIEAKVGRENGYFVYELKAPLAKTVSRPYAIQAWPGSSIGLGWEIPPPGAAFAPEGQDRAGPMPEEGGRGGYPGEAFQLWATVTLSSGRADSFSQ
jgi:hypothetical protein